MRRHRATILNDQEIQQNAINYPNSILQQKNVNIFDTIFTKCTNKKNIFTKKSICLKLQQAQRDHCCINIVNRKNVSCVSQQRNVSNIQFLKQHINYLERDQLKWDMFPKENQQSQVFSSTITSQKNNRNDYQMHSVNRITMNEQPTTLKAFKNTFKQNFHLNNQNSRPLTSDQRRIFKYIEDKNKPVRKSSVSERTKAIIHSNVTLNTPFRKYFQNSRTKRNQSCTVNINRVQGQRITTKNSFMIEDFTAD